MFKKFFAFLCLVVALSAQENPLEVIKQEISQAYSQFYHNYAFSVRGVEAQIAGGNIADLKNPEPVINWRNQQFLRKDGLVSVGQRGHQVWIKYQVLADIQVYKSKTMLKKDQNLDATNTYAKSVPFEYFNAMPIDRSYIGNASTRSFLGANTTLSVDKVGPRILIYKHEIFSATLKEGPISLETSLQALENGVLNQVIQALNIRSKRVVQVKITGLLKGEVLWSWLWGLVGLAGWN